MGGAPSLPNCGDCKTYDAGAVKCRCMVSGGCETVDNPRICENTTGKYYFIRREKNANDPNGQFYLNCRRVGCNPGGCDTGLRRVDTNFRWSNWSKCENGKQYRIPTENSSNPCNPQPDERKCCGDANTEWKNVGTCSKECGDGLQLQERSVNGQKVLNINIPNSRWMVTGYADCCVLNINVFDYKNTSKEKLIVGVGLDLKLYSKKNIYEPWVFRGSNINIWDIEMLRNEVMLGVGQDGYVYTKNNFNENWSIVDGSCCVISISESKAHGWILGIGTDRNLYYRLTALMYGVPEIRPWVNNRTGWILAKYPKPGVDLRTVRAILKSYDEDLIIATDNNGRMWTKNDNPNYEWQGPFGMDTQIWSLAPLGDDLIGIDFENRLRIKNVYEFQCQKQQQSVKCKIKNCETDCNFDWGEWSVCDYNTETRFRDPIIKEQPVAGGKKCPERQTEKCILNCEFNWGKWSNCDSDTGTRFRDPVITTKPTPTGKKCPDRQTEDCDVNCEYKFSDWSECSKRCGNDGIQERDVIIIKNKKNNGTCPTKETRPCNRIPCPIDCKVSKWEYQGNCNQLEK